MENKVKKLEFDIIGENEVKVRVKNGILIGFENGNVNAYIGNISASQYIDAVLIMHRIVDEIGAGKAFEEWSIQSLAEYASTGLTPDQIREIDKLYQEKCEELVAERKKNEHLTLLTTGTDELELSIRTYNCLKREGINNLAELCRKTEKDLMKIRNMGRKSLEEILEALKERGLHLKESANG